MSGYCAAGVGYSLAIFPFETIESRSNHDEVESRRNRSGPIARTLRNFPISRGRVPMPTDNGATNKIRELLKRKKKKTDCRPQTKTRLRRIRV